MCRSNHPAMPQKSPCGHMILDEAGILVALSVRIRVHLPASSLCLNAMRLHKSNREAVEAPCFSAKHPGRPGVPAPHFMIIRTVNLKIQEINGSRMVTSYNDKRSTSGLMS